MKRGVLENLEHKRAEEAWACVDYVNSEIDRKKFKKEYRSIVLRLPALIITNGLGQTLAYLKSKGKGEDPDKNPHERVYRDIEGWLNSRVKWRAKGDLIERVISLDSNNFRYVTQETLAFLSWLKRFADAVLPKEDEE